MLVIYFKYRESESSVVSLCDPMDRRPPGCSVHGILQARILEWVARPSPKLFILSNLQFTGHCKVSSHIAFTQFILVLTYIQFSSVAQSCLTLCEPMNCGVPGSSVHEDSPGKNTGVGCHALLQGSSQPRDRTQVSRVAGRRFTVRATREALCV